MSIPALWWLGFPDHHSDELYARYFHFLFKVNSSSHFRLESPVVTCWIYCFSSKMVELYSPGNQWQLIHDAEHNCRKIAVVRLVQQWLSPGEKSKDPIVVQSMKPDAFAAYLPCWNPGEIGSNSGEEMSPQQDGYTNSARMRASRQKKKKKVLLPCPEGLA